MQTNETTPRVLKLTLTEEDADLLRTAAMATPALAEASGNTKHIRTLANVALVAICRAILKGGYQPKPLAAELVAEPAAIMEANTIVIPVN